MRKIVIKNKEEFLQLQKEFPLTARRTIYEALSFKSHSLNASLIRCYAMNFLSSAELLTTK